MLVGLRGGCKHSTDQDWMDGPASIEASVSSRPCCGDVMKLHFLPISQLEEEEEQIQVEEEKEKGRMEADRKEEIIFNLLTNILVNT